MKKVAIIFVLALIFISKSKAILVDEHFELMDYCEGELILNEETNFYEVTMEVDFDVDSNNVISSSLLYEDLHTKKSGDVLFEVEIWTKGEFSSKKIYYEDLEYFHEVYKHISNTKIEFNDEIDMTFVSNGMHTFCFGQDYEKTKFKVNADLFSVKSQGLSFELYNKDNITTSSLISIDFYLESFEYYDKAAPIISGNDVVYTDVGAPIERENIVKGLKAIDEYCGDLSNQLIIEETNYNPLVVGEYYMKVAVTDKFENKATKQITIRVVDFYSPVITGQNYYEVGIVKYITIDEIINNLKITDNSKSDIVINCVDNYTENKNTPGEYVVTIEAIDATYNVSKYDVIVKVIDDKEPIVNGEDLTIKMSENKSIEDLKKFSFSDNQTKMEELIVDFETNFNPLKKGEYYIKCIVSDELGNSGSKEIKITLIDDIKPSFVVSNSIFKNMLTYDEIHNYFNKA